MKELLSVVVLLLLIVGASLIPQPSTKAVFLDVGQGDSILLQDGTTQVLIDGGPGRKVLERLSEELPWLDRTLEVVVATHADRDHLEGLLYVLEHYDVRLVLLPRFPHTTDLQKVWLSELEQKVTEKKIAYRFAQRGQRITADGLALTFLGPSPNRLRTGAGSKTNNAGVLTRVDFHDLSLLLTADAEASVEQELVATTQPELLDITVLKAGHHGSKTSTTAALLAAASPNVVVISVGQDNSYGHPHPTVLERLKSYDTWRTDQHGSVQFTYRDTQWFMPRPASD